ncbi:MAG TPA: choice-of-anchor tandem repeat GloVer-containing protein [Terriglobales bacterium]|nr:choice-of-anchor tandem repeat GloVer-containing protein [Terriglobales bacterium]
MGTPRNRTSSRGLAAVSVVTLLLLISAGKVTLANAQAQVHSATLTPVDAAQSATHYKYKALYEFCDSSGCPDIPNGDLIFDTAGNLYGTTFEGGDPACGLGCGTVFQLSPRADGTWKLATIFKFDGEDGAYPAAGLVMDAAGNLYGTTSGDTGLGDGTAFKLSPRKDGIWTITTLVKFTGKNGSDPEARLILDAAGNLYGTTTAGGNSVCDGSGCGTVFQLAPVAKGKWKLTTLFEFNGTDGAGPYSALIFDAAGNLYGTASGGGKFGEGTVFKLSPAKGGAWTPTTLFNFNGADGAGPRGSVVFDAAGNLYGTTVGGGEPGFGTVFKLSPEGNGIWKHTTLVTFDIANGSQPTAGLIFDPDGNLYGNANDGRFGIGIVFRLSPQGDGKWKETTLLTFNGENGSGPAGGLLLDAAGDLYGSASVEGKRNGGVVFELSPVRGKAQ